MLLIVTDSISLQPYNMEPDRAAELGNIICLIGQLAKAPLPIDLIPSSK